MDLRILSYNSVKPVRNPERERTNKCKRASKSEKASKREREVSTPKALRSKRIDTVDLAGSVFCLVHTYSTAIKTDKHDRIASVYTQCE